MWQELLTRTLNRRHQFAFRVLNGRKSSEFTLGGVAGEGAPCSACSWKERTGGGSLNLTVGWASSSWCWCGGARERREAMAAVKACYRGQWAVVVCLFWPWRKTLMCPLGPRKWEEGLWCSLHRENKFLRKNNLKKKGSLVRHVKQTFVPNKFLGLYPTNFWVWV